MSVTHPETGQTSYAYNSDGTVRTKTDARSVVTEYVYDAYKRVTQVKVGGFARYTYTYDADPFGSGSYPAGRLSTVSYDSAEYGLTEKYAYTQSGLVTKKRLRCGGPGDVDPVSGAGRRERADLHVQLRRDGAAEQADQERDANQGRFDGFGNRTAQTVTKGSAPSSSLTYNMATNRLTGASYVYDAAGNLTQAPGPGGCVMRMIVTR
ncbi:MAG: hypothetical protein KIT09_33365 [Bryobacteraceae bacterium]|nr:hypothetical protein [Bryobacteraceae bacterium]